MSSTNAARPSSFSLPIFLTRENKYRYAVLAASVGTVSYLIPNHFPILEPRLLQMSSLDLAMPFVPWTFWIYLSEYLLFLSVYVLCKDMVNTSKYLYSFFTMQMVACLIFVVWPTTFPRDQFPLVRETMDPVTYWAFDAFRRSDTPNNCCPSLHVASVYLASFVFLDEQREKFPYYFAWASAVAVSTLTTKQHYFVDVVAGLALAWCAWWFFHRVARYRPIAELQPSR